MENRAKSADGTKRTFVGGDLDVGGGQAHLDAVHQVLLLVRQETLRRRQAERLVGQLAAQVDAQAVAADAAVLLAERAEPGMAEAANAGRTQLRALAERRQVQAGLAARAARLRAARAVAVVQLAATERREAGVVLVLLCELGSWVENGGLDKALLDEKYIFSKLKHFS